jgi:hypothetical protein
MWYLEKRVCALERLPGRFAITAVTATLGIARSILI